MTRPPMLPPQFSGRVTVRMRGAAANATVLETAVVVARAFRFELLGLFVEDERLMTLAAMPFVREISVMGVRGRQLSPDIVRREMRAAAAAMEREFSRMARSLPARFVSMVEGAAPSPADTRSGTEILAVGEPLALAVGDELAGLMADPGSVAGVVVAGPNARRVTGPVLAVIASAGEVEPVAGAAARIAQERGETVEAVIVSGRDRETLEQDVRARLGAARLSRFDDMSPGVLAALVDRCRSGLVVAGMHGALASDSATATRYACAIRCPLLLMS